MPPKESMLLKIDYRSQEHKCLRHMKMFRSNNTTWEFQQTIITTYVTWAYWLYSALIDRNWLHVFSLFPQLFEQDRWQVPLPKTRVNGLTFETITMFVKDWKLIQITCKEKESYKQSKLELLSSLWTHPVATPEIYMYGVISFINRKLRCFLLVQESREVVQIDTTFLSTSSWVGLMKMSFALWPVSFQNSMFFDLT